MSEQLTSRLTKPSANSNLPQITINKAFTVVLRDSLGEEFEKDFDSIDDISKWVGKSKSVVYKAFEAPRVAADNGFFRVYRNKNKYVIGDEEYETITALKAGCGISGYIIDKALMLKKIEVQISSHSE